MRGHRYSEYEFIGWVKQAYALFEANKKWRAFRLLRKTLKHYDEDIPAYIYIKYSLLWSAFEEEYEVNNSIKTMTDDELHDYISDAVCMNQSVKRKGKYFRRGAKRVFEDYLRGLNSIQNLQNKLSVLEKECIFNGKYTSSFKREMIFILAAYFWGREFITRKTLNMYLPYFTEWFVVQTYEDMMQMREAKELQEDKEWPEAIECAVFVNNVWSYFYLDPTIPQRVQTKNHSLEHDEDRIAIFQSMIEFQHSFAGEKAEHNGHQIVANWFELMEKYPQLAEKTVECGKQYYARREEHLKEKKIQQEQKLLAIPATEREKIVRIFNHWNQKWIHVVE